MDCEVLTGTVDIKAHLKTLSEVHAPSGYETAAREAILSAWQPLTDAQETSRLGSLVAYKHGSGAEPRRRIMLCAHMDEIGMIVSRIEGAFIRVGSLGGIDSRAIIGKPVLVHTREGALQGVVGALPLSMLSDDQRGRYPSLEEIYIDLGLAAEAVARRVRVGDIVTMNLPLLELQDRRVAGKAMDNRACVAVISACLDALQRMKHSWDVLAVASVQEEVGLHGARAEAYRLNPDIAIALDVTFAPQPNVPSPTFELGGGVPLALGANFHPALFEAIKKTAERLEMSLPIDPVPMASGTDAWAIQISRDGIPTALLSIPTRNMHTTVETVDLRDIERGGRLLAEFIAALDEQFLTEIVWDKPEQTEKKDA
ncbi:MAG: M42 family peptidase [Chloroflexota bacterium]|nr:MAG: M42 family peptidase [Chloroflexota bacterium]